MRVTGLLRATLVALIPSLSYAGNANASVDTSRHALPETFTPPQVFEHIDVQRNINLEKNYARHTIDAVVENIASTPQDEYYLPFEAADLARVGRLEARTKGGQDEAFAVEVVGYDNLSPTQFYKIKFHQPLRPKAQKTFQISFNLLSASVPLPAKIEQMDKQYMQFSFSAYSPSAYKTSKQKTKLKLPTTLIPDFTKIPGTNSENKEDPTAQGSTLTYGSFGEVPAGAVEPVSVRYEYLKPVNHVSSLERDLEVSHWGGNLATEERYLLEHRGAGLKSHFSRTVHTSAMYFGQTKWVTQELNMPLKAGSTDAYYVDDVGNVTTSRFRSSSRESHLTVKPRYPLYGGWHYKFKVGWNQDLKTSLRKLKTGSSYVLKVPFLEGPKGSEGIEYARMKLRVILPEGAENVRFETAVPHLSSEISHMKTFMDTIGRTVLTIDAINLCDDLRGKEIFVTYDYPFMASFRKPFTIIAGVFSIFVMAWVLGSVDVRIGKRS